MATIKLREPTQEKATIKEAAEKDYVHILQELTSSGVNVTGFIDDMNNTALHFAALEGSNNVITFLLDNRAGINAVDKFQFTPLHRAATNGCTNSVALLVARGADINMKSMYNMTPVELAVINNHSATVYHFVKTLGMDITKIAKGHRKRATKLVKEEERKLQGTTKEEDLPELQTSAEESSLSLAMQNQASLKASESFDPSCWTKGKFLDGGAIGKVYLFHGIDSNCQLAVKEVEIVPCTPQKDVKSLETEIGILKELKHQCIVLYYGTSRTDKYIRIFMEYMTRGSVYSCLHSNGAFTETLTKKYTKQILEGIDYLHSKKIVHRDMKGANVLINSNEDVKIADFGISKQLETIHQSSRGDKNTGIGTILWMAPEMINRKYAVGPKADIWSIGCTVVEMLTCFPPLGKMEWQMALYEIGKEEPVRYDLPPQCSQHVRSFLNMCLSKEVEARATASDLLKHIFVNQDA